MGGIKGHRGIFFLNLDGDHDDDDDDDDGDGDDSNNNNNNNNDNNHKVIAVRKKKKPGTGSLRPSQAKDAISWPSRGMTSRRDWFELLWLSKCTEN